MSRRKNMAHIYCENYMTGINHPYLFETYYDAKHGQSIINRLKENFPAPDFRVIHKRINYDTGDCFTDGEYVDNYVVYIEWGPQSTCTIL